MSVHEVAGCRLDVPAGWRRVPGLDAERWIAVEPALEDHFSFNYDEPVEFDENEPVLDSSWVREFKEHPRPWALIPEWCYVKTAFTEAEWAEQVAEFERTGRHADN